MATVERHEEPVNLEGSRYIPIERFEVAEYHEMSEGQGPATQVHMTMNVEGMDDLPLVLRFKSHRSISHLIESLTVHRNNVWPEVRS